MSTRHRLRRQNGLSMIELIMFMVIVSIALVGILQVLNLTSKYSADPLRRKQALAIAEGLLEEVQLAGFTFCDPSDAQASTAIGAVVGARGCQATVEGVDGVGPEPAIGLAPANTRPFDNINDYLHKDIKYGDADVNAFNVGGTLADATRSPMLFARASGPPIEAEAAGYAASLTLTPESLGGIASDADPANMNVLRITVRVVYGADDSDVVVLDAYRTRYAPN